MGNRWRINSQIFVNGHRGRNNARERDRDCDRKMDGLMERREVRGDGKKRERSKRVEGVLWLSGRERGSDSFARGKAALADQGGAQSTRPLCRPAHLGQRRGRARAGAAYALVRARAGRAQARLGAGGGAAGLLAADGDGGRGGGQGYAARGPGAGDVWRVRLAR